jgi:hypothetical protein
LTIFRDRDFSLSNIGIAVIGFAVTAMVLPLVFYAQAVCGLSPTRSALLLAPMAVAAGVLAPAVGKITDRSHPRTVIGFGFSMLAIALTWLSMEMTPTTPIWRLVLPFVGMGVGMAFIWAPLGATATRNLPQHLAGAGSGVYNATRQVGSVLGSASMAAFMTARISAELPPRPPGASGSSNDGVLVLPAFLHEPFASAMSQSMLLPAFVALFGVVAAIFLVGFARTAPAAPAPVRVRVRRVGEDRALHDPTTDPTDEIPVVADFDEVYDHDGYVDYGDDDYGDDDYVEYDDDGYVEYDDGDYVEYDEAYVEYDDDPVYDGDPDAAYIEYRVPQAQPEIYSPAHDPRSAAFVDDSDTAPLVVAVARPLPRPVQPIGLAHNGFHVEDDQRFSPLGALPAPLADPSTARYAGSGGVNGRTALDAEFAALWAAANSPKATSARDQDTGRRGTSRHAIADDYFSVGAGQHRGSSDTDDDLLGNASSSRHQLPEPGGRHFGVESEDPATYGRHSMPGRD